MKKSFSLLLLLLTLIVLAACQNSTSSGYQSSGSSSSSSSSSTPADYSKLTVIKIFSGEFSGTIEDIAFTPDGKSLVNLSIELIRLR